jgi:type 1 glutamine amidotransferase
MNFFLTLSLAAMSVFGAGGAVDEPIHVLILSGQNNHDWRETTPFLKKVLTSSGDCVVDVTEAPENITAQSLKRYHVLVSNWNAYVEDGVFAWPEAARSALVEFVRGGKGFVSVHAGASSFYDWDAYQELGIASWKDGRTDHGPAHTFTVNPVGDHPIIRGLEPFKTHDELWHDAQVQPGAEVLATAFSAKENGGSGKDEPMVACARVRQGAQREYPSRP